ncbi:Uncharacterized RNA methyltransferase pc0248 [Chlamydiales bacterium SCGC AB-751-O23]|jgi:23S rRNA (uracil1939-C5)-methyltransferase|nr:Uncharacterized RNA methyltransferase pc0248 [Chlamydiales bacterium SCGC AB-751-O23]
MTSKHLEIDQILQGKVDTIAFGGEGILKTEFGVVFVPFCLPDEEIEIKITAVKKKYAKGQILRILNPSEKRIEGKCPHFMKCGGCQLQHSEYTYQVQLKKRFLKDCLERIALQKKLPEIIVTESPKNFAYRKRIEWSLHKDKESKVCVGTYRSLEKNRPSFKVESCPIFLESNDFIVFLQKELESLPLPEKVRSRLRIIQHSPKSFTLLFHFKAFFRGFESWAEKLSESNDYRLNICFSSPEMKGEINPWKKQYKFGEFSFSFSPFGFVQNNFEASEKLYSELRDILKEKNKLYGLDLFSGVGISSLFLSSLSKKITSVERSRHCCEEAEKNNAINKIENVKVCCEDVYEFAKNNSFKPFDWVLLNPPREGVRQPLLEKLKEVKKVIYVSCNPSTLSRDIKILCEEGGFRLSSIRLFDLFPQTTHLETLIVLKR